MSNESLKQSILERIEREGVCPRSRVWFRTQECVVWTLWLVSVIVGALAVAVTLYALVLRQYSLYEVTHGSFWWSLATALPYLWLLAFVGMAVFAVYNLRHTKRGYRYPLWQIIVSSVIISVLTGFGLHVAGLGFMTDNLLGQRLALYQSQQKYERALWQQPEEGRIIAIWEAAGGKSDEILMRDIDNVLWTVDISAVATDERALLEHAKLTKVLGMVTNDTDKHFTACGSAAWYFDKPMSRDELLTEREAFWQRIRRHRQRLDRATPPPVESDSTAVAQKNDSGCAELGFMNRMPQQ